MNYEDFIEAYPYPDNEPEYDALIEQFCQAFRDDFLDSDSWQEMD